jgi:hypothetical protein
MRLSDKYSFNKKRLVTVGDLKCLRLIIVEYRGTPPEQTIEIHQREMGPDALVLVLNLQDKTCLSKIGSELKIKFTRPELEARMTEVFKAYLDAHGGKVPKDDLPMFELADKVFDAADEIVLASQKK